MRAIALLLLLAGIKVAGVDFAPRDLIFASVEPKSRAAADGPLPGGCKWSFVSETRVAKREDEKACVRYYYKTTVELDQVCPAPNEKQVPRMAERITSTQPQCPDGAGKVAPPQTEAKVLSSGITAEGKHQDIVIQPDGTRIVLAYDDVTVNAYIGFPDGSGDALKQPK